MGGKNLEQVLNIAHRFAQQRYPDARLALVCGSWARGCAHQDSDIDLFVIDSTVNDLLFEGLFFDSCLIEVCALPPQRVETFFASSARNRSAPVPHQVLNGIVVAGMLGYAEEVKAAARSVLAHGPDELNTVEKLDLRWQLTALLHDLTHAAAEEVPALAAQCHTQLAQAAIDAARGWRGERKTLRRALRQSLPALVEPLDAALIDAIQGDRQPMLKIGHQILEQLGGRQRTYLERYSPQSAE